MRKRLWSPDEDEKLQKYVSQHGFGNWSEVAKKTGLQRCGKSCRLRWINYLRPDLKRGKLSPEEKMIIINLQKVFGNSWSKIAAHLPGRTDSDIKNFWHSHFRKMKPRQAAAAAAMAMQSMLHDIKNVNSSSFLSPAAAAACHLLPTTTNPGNPNSTFHSNFSLTPNPSCTRPAIPINPTTGPNPNAKTNPAPIPNPNPNPNPNQLHSIFHLHPNPHSHSFHPHPHPLHPNPFLTPPPPHISTLNVNPNTFRMQLLNGTISASRNDNNDSDIDEDDDCDDEDNASIITTNAPVATITSSNANLTTTHVQPANHPNPNHQHHVLTLLEDNMNTSAPNTNHLTINHPWLSGSSSTNIHDITLNHHRPHPLVHESMIRMLNDDIITGNPTSSTMTNDVDQHLIHQPMPMISIRMHDDHDPHLHDSTANYTNHSNSSTDHSNSSMDDPNNSTIDIDSPSAPEGLDLVVWSCVNKGPPNLTIAEAVDGLDLQYDHDHHDEIDGNIRHHHDRMNMIMMNISPTNSGGDVVDDHYIVSRHHHHHHHGVDHGHHEMLDDTVDDSVLDGDPHQLAELLLDGGQYNHERHLFGASMITSTLNDVDSGDVEVEMVTTGHILNSQKSDDHVMCMNNVAATSNFGDHRLQATTAPFSLIPQHHDVVAAMSTPMMMSTIPMLTNSSKC